MQERRQYIRIDKSLSISYQKLSDYMRSPSRSKDISETGLRLYVFHRLEPGTTLKLWIDFKDAKEPIVAIGEVVWLNRRNDAENPFEVGIKFVEINPANRDKLINFIKSKKESKEIDWKG